jgi:hypothetical protein
MQKQLDKIPSAWDWAEFKSPQHFEGKIAIVLNIVVHCTNVIIICIWFIPGCVDLICAEFQAW